MRLFGALIVGIFTGIVISYFALALDKSEMAVNSAIPTSQSMQWVDRTHKGSRLDIPATEVGKQHSPAPRLLTGCEPTASPLSSDDMMPGRCAV